MYDRNFRSCLLYMSDLRHCRSLLRAGSRSFFAASLLLPTLYRRPITALYAFCRVADDEIDSADADSRALDRLYRRLDRIYAGAPGNDPVDRAFADVVHTYEIPIAIPAALLEGFEWDIANRRYDSMSDVYAYGARVAGTVGTMMAMIMGVRHPTVLSRACDLGVAMQITNIARDVGEDAGAGRLYLPRSMLRDNGIDPDDWLRSPEYTAGLGDVIRQLLEAAEVLYTRADWGLTKLPAGCRPGMFAARAIYAEIGREIEKRELDSVSGRAVVGGRRKLALLLRAIRRATEMSGAEDAPALDEVKFLLDAIPHISRTG